MKKIELQPTEQNLIEMLEKDIVNRNEKIRNFIELLDFIDENVSICINGDWGSGKTFFIKQIVLLLTYYNNYIKDNNREYNTDIERILTNSSILKDISLANNFVPIYYNAWDNDSHQDPIASIIFNIVKENNLNGYQKITKSNFEKIGSILDVINPWSSGSISNLISTCKSEDITVQVSNMETAKSILKELLEKILVEKGDKLIIFIDELDRCSPIYAVKLLERIKHFFDDDRLIFVFSTNNSQLVNTISNYYGSNFDSFKYLNKFFDLTFDIGNVNSSEYMKHLGIKNNSKYFDNAILLLSNYFNLSMRDCNRYMQSVRLVKDYIESLSGSFREGRGRLVVLMFFLPILLALKIVDIKKFMDVMNGNGYEIMKEIIVDIPKLKEWISSYMNQDKDTKEISDLSFDEQLFKIYSVLFNNNEIKSYENSEIEIDYYTKEELMSVVSLLKKGLKYD